MTFEEWLEEVENILWIRLSSTTEEYDADFEALYDKGVDPEQVVYELYESEDEE